MTYSSSHHAVLYVYNNRQEEAEKIWAELSKSSPAHRFFNQTVLDIDAAREITSWANTPYNDEKIALISFHTAGVPAQNAMLKVLEEPPQGVKFIIITSNKEHLLDTVLSRLEYVKGKGDEEKSIDKDAKIFLETSPTSRMKLPEVVSLLAQMDEEGRKDREAVRGFILSLSELLLRKNAESKYILETLEVASYASDPSASGKALLEYLALLLPQTK